MWNIQSRYVFSLPNRKKRNVHKLINKSNYMIVHTASEIQHCLKKKIAN